LAGQSVDEAPEWLQALSVESGAAAAPEEESVLPYAADTLLSKGIEGEIESESELPEWLAAAAAEVGADSEAPSGAAEEGLPEWLMQMGVEPADQEEELGGEDEALFDEQALAWVEGLTVRQEEGLAGGAEAQAAMAELAALTATEDLGEAGLEGLTAPDEGVAAEAFGWTLFGEQPAQPAPAEAPPEDDTAASLESVADLAVDAALDWTALEEEAPLVTVDAEAHSTAETAGIATPEEIGVPSLEEDFGWDLLGVEETAPPAPEPPLAPAAPEPTEGPAAEQAFGWTAFGKMGALAEPAIADAEREPLAQVPEIKTVSPPETSSERPTPVLPEEEVAPSEPDQFSAERARLKEHPRDHEGWLSLARSLWRAEQQEEALDAYGRLIRSGEMLEEVISDLEKWNRKAEDAAAQRALGDAYMKAGRLDEALDVFRRALDAL
jgi:tetratricopeptide (TPR) repeat protein